MMRVRINLTLDPSVMFRSFHIDLSRIIVVVHWAILDKISALDPASDMMSTVQLLVICLQVTHGSTS